MPKDKILAGLNPRQKSAIEHGRGPLLIIAGAGTGKTTVITRRIAHLISQKLAEPEEIIALTFTDKAASEMEERVDLLVPYGYTNTWISTFHAFGDHILREHALEIGLTPDFKVLTKPEQIVFFREHLFEFPIKYYRPLGDPTRYLEAMVTLFSRAKDEDISPERYLQYVAKSERKAGKRPRDSALKEEVLREKEVALCYKKYQELLMREGKVDFGNQVYLALELFRRHPAILLRYQKQFKYILVDEFQDTNFSQFQLVKLLAKGKENIAVVADDDQCLPPGSLISTPGGQCRIEKVKVGDKVLAGVGKGHAGSFKVAKVFRRRKKARFLTFKTESGYRLTVTSNHKMFCFIPGVSPSKNIYYVYLMWRQDLGWRLGVTNDLSSRLRLERSADKIVGIKAFAKEEAAQYFETLLSLKYGIPTTCFMERRGLFIKGEYLKKLYREIDTATAARKLARDLDVDLSCHHCSLDAVRRGSKTRIKIGLELCHRRHVSKSGYNRILINPSIIHSLILETSDKATIKRLRKAGIPLRKAGKGIRVRITSSKITALGAMAERLERITGGIIENTFKVGRFNLQHLPALVMPASNVLPGHYLPALKKNRIIYDRIKKITETVKTETVYDLEIERVHNFIADGIVVHNSVFKFRGAAISNILNFMSYYPRARKVVLTRNYRSHQAILDDAYRLIRHNDPDRLEVTSNIEKRLRGTSKKGPAPRCLYCDTVSTEADEVARIIEEKIKSGKYELGDFAILVRSNNDADPFLRALNMRSLPWRFSGNQGLYRREEIRLIISFLRSVVRPQDSLSLYHLASSEIYCLDMLDLTRLMNYATRRNLSLYSVFQRLEEIEEFQGVPEESRAVVRKLIGDLRAYNAFSRARPTGELIYRFLQESGYLKRLSKIENPASGDKVQNIAKFFEIVRATGEILDEDRAPHFVNHIDLLVQAGDDPAVVEADLDIPAINVLTIHKAKGLEFRVVFMVSLVMGRFPWPRRPELISLPEELIKEILPTGDFHIEEERRLFYVGMTRAKEELYLSGARDYGGTRLRKISQFVREALNLSKGPLAVKKATAAAVIERSALSSPKPPGRKAGEIGKKEVLNLSYFQIDDYLTCPLKYKYVHILRVPVLRHHAVIYGKALHDAVQRYNEAKLSGKKVSLKELMETFESSWASEGFLTREHEKERLRAGKASLRKFWRRQEKDETRPVYVEKEFSFLLDYDRLRGRWDRIDQKGGRAVIIDFKSSGIRRQEEADRRTRESLQLAIYALAYKMTFGKLPSQVQLHFLESGLVGEDEKEEKDLEKVIKKIKEASAGIRKRKFPARPAYFACRFCAYREICPYTAAR